MEVLQSGLVAILFCIFHLASGSSLPNDERAGLKAEIIQAFESYVVPIRQEVENSKSEMARMKSEHNRDIANLRDQILQIRGSYEIEIENLRKEFEDKIADCRAEAAIEIAKVKNGYVSDGSKLEVKNSENVYTSPSETTVTQVADSYETEKQRSFDQLQPKTTDNLINNGSVYMKEKTLEDQPTPKGRKFLTENGHRIRRDITGPRVAFFAKLTTHATNLGINQPLFFDNVVTNYGGGYDKNIGTFRAPVSGVYLFSVTVTTYRDNNGHFGIYVNQNQITFFYLNGKQNNYDETSQTIIVHLAAADDVTVRSIGESNKGALGQEHTIFSGTLLFEDSEQSVIIGK